MENKTYIILFILFFCIMAFGQQTAEIHGKVTDSETGLPVVGANIVLENLGQGASSDEDGKFLIIGVSSGKHAISTSCIGYATQVQTSVIIESGQTLQIDFLLHPSIETTETIPVLKDREAMLKIMLPSNVTRINLAEGEKSGNSEVADLLAKQAGLFIKTHGGTGQLSSISLRGMAAEQTQILFDGIPLNSLQLGSANLSQYKTGNLSTIEVYRGGNAVYGGTGAIGGAINLQPIAPAEKLDYSAQIGLASFQNRDINLAMDVPLGAYKQRMYASYEEADNSYSAGKSVALKNRDFKHLNLSYQNTYAISEELTISGYFSTFKNESGAAKAFISAETEQVNLARNANENNMAILRAKYISGTGLLYAHSYVRNEWMEYTDPALNINNQSLRSLHFNHESGVLLRGNYLLYRSLLVIGGLEASQQRITSTDAGKHTGQKTAAYLMTDWQPFGIMDSSFNSFRINAKFRYEDHAQFGEVFLPGIGLSYQFDKFNLFASIGKNYRAPSFNDLFWVPGGNPELKPEQALNIEAGISLTKSFRTTVLSLQSAVYRNEVTDQIKWLPEAGFWQAGNIAEVESRGIELKAGLSHKNEIHAINLNYSLGRAEKTRAEFDGDKTVGNQLPLLPEEQWQMALQSGWKIFRFGLQATGMSFRYKTIENESSDIVPGNTIYTMWINYHFQFFEQSGWLGFAVNNLTDLEYENIPGYPMPPRNYRIKFSVHR